MIQSDRTRPGGIRRPFCHHANRQVSGARVSIERSRLLAQRLRTLFARPESLWLAVLRNKVARKCSPPALFKTFVREHGTRLGSVKIARLFSEHPASVGETYTEHM